MKAYKALFILLVFVMSIFTNTAFALEGNFPDVTVENTTYEAIKYLKGKNILEGYPDGTFKPKNEINRAEFTKIVMGPIIEDMTKKDCFPDVKDEWFAPYICEAKAKGIIGGYPDGTFKPEQKINFSEASKIIAEAYNIKKGEASSDAERWYKTYITGLEKQNVIPLSIEFFDENITREEMSEMIYRLDAKVGNKATRTYNEMIGEGFVTVNSCEELEERYDYVLNQSYYYDEIYDYSELPVARSEEQGSMLDSELNMKESLSTDGLGADGLGSDEGFSSTNVQVEGVDEADIIKNDGKYIYLVKGNTVRIVEAYPAENLKELISMSLGEEEEEFSPVELFVNKDTLVVMGRLYKDLYREEAKYDEYEMSIYPYYYKERTKVYVLDISNRTKPVITRSVEFEGGYTTSRRIGDTLYLVISDTPYYYGFGDIMPLMNDSSVGKDEPITECSKVKILPKPQNFNYIITASIPLNDVKKPIVREVIAGDAQNVYASSKNLYVASTDWGNGYMRSYNENDSSIYKFELGKDQIKYKAQGKVPGVVLNQFSMDEKGGSFRVATTANEFVMGKEMSNNMYILDENLKMTGKLEKIAPGEKIYSVRFMGDRAYMVTFDRVDPLFVLDVSTSGNPKILGELKIPGFSTYLHPYDENHILGFGNEVEEDENDTDGVWSFNTIKGVKIGMFDVTNVNKPIEMFKEVIGDMGTYSEVLYNHKALLFNKDKGLLALPITVYKPMDSQNCTSYTYSTCPDICNKMCVPSECSYENGVKVCTTDCDGVNSCTPYEFTWTVPEFDGAYVYNVDLKDGFKLKGKISHYTEKEEKEMLENAYTDYEKAVDRLLYIGETLYSVSKKRIKANLLSDLKEQSVIDLAGSSFDYYW